MKEKKEIIEIEKNLFVSKPKNLSNIVPLFCPKCEFPLRTSEDSASYRGVGCCNMCFRHWFKKGEENFPKKDSKEWQEYLRFRKESLKTKINLK